MKSVHSKWVQVAVLGIIVGILGSASSAERSVIVGEPKEHIENAIYVTIPAPSKVELWSERWL